MTLQPAILYSYSEQMLYYMQDTKYNQCIWTHLISLCMSIKNVHEAIKFVSSRYIS